MMDGRIESDCGVTYAPDSVSMAMKFDVENSSMYCASAVVGCRRRNQQRHRNTELVEFNPLQTG